MKKGLDGKKDFSALFFAVDRSLQKLTESFIYPLCSKEEQKAKMDIKKKGVWIFIAAILVIFVFALTSGVASATTHVVNKTAACTTADPDNPINYHTTIQAAINAANPYDTIIVCPEATAYQEAVNVKRSDIVIKAFNEIKPVVSAQNDPNKHVFKIDNRVNVTLQGFAIRDAFGNTNPVAGLYMRNASDCKIVDNSIFNISATGNNAFGIRLGLSSNNNTFSSSTSISYINATSNAYGIALWNSNNNTFSSSTSISYINATDNAFGIRLGSSNNNSFSSSTSISYINAPKYAYGISLWTSNNNNFTDTSARNVNATVNASGIYLTKSTNNNFTDTRVRNVSAADTCGVFLAGSSDNNTFDTTRIENVDLPNNSLGVRIWNSNDNHFTDTSIKNVQSNNNNAHAISLVNSDHNNFDTTLINDVGAVANNSIGARLQNSNNNSFTDTSIENVLTQSTFKPWKRAYGVRLLENSNDNRFVKTKIREVYSSRADTDYYGFWIGGKSSRNEILDGEITNCGHGIWIKFGSANRIKRNIIRDNTIDTGVHLESQANDTEIHGNCLFDNVHQAMDNGTGNNWDRNFWSPPPSGPGNYTIPGTAGRKDHNPLSSCPLIPAKVPTLTPIGIIALIGLLSVIAAMSIKIMKRRG